MDRRTRRTRKAIFDAFESILMEKRYEQITVQDIIDRADIGRSTFYSHFDTKDSLLEAICADLFDHIFAEHPKAEDGHDFSGSTDAEATRLRGRLTHILYHLMEDQHRYERIFNCESANLFWSYFREGFTSGILPFVKPLLAQRQIHVPQDYYLDFYCSSFIETVKWWFRGGLEVSPEDLESYFEIVTMRC